MHGLVGHRTVTNDDQFKRPLVIVIANLDYLRDIKGSNYIRNRVIKVAQKLRADNVDVTFAVSGIEEYRHDLTEFGIADIKSTEKYVLGRGPNNEKFKHDDEYT